MPDNIVTQSKKIPILKPFIHPVTNKPIHRLTDEKIKELGILPNENLDKYADKLEKITLGDVIGSLFDNVTCPKPSLFLLYGNIINWINKANSDNIDHITLTKEECKNFKSIFENTIIKKPELNAYVLFLIQSFDIFIKNFDTLESNDEIKKEENTPEIATTES